MSVEMGLLCGIPSLAGCAHGLRNAISIEGITAAYKKQLAAFYTRCNTLIINGAAPVAQRLEQGTHNPLVAGSNPTGSTLMA